MPSISANGCQFHYQMEGSGDDIIFIHGEIHGSGYWEYQLSDFSKQYRCFVYDRRGHANTEWTDYGFSLVNQTRDLEALIEKLGIKNPIIIALAFGTTIAANYAIQNPDKVRALVLGAWSEMHDAFQYFTRWKGYSVEAARVLESEGREALINFLSKNGGRSIYKVIPISSPVREKIVQMFASHPLGEYTRGMLEFGLSVPNLVTALSALDIPVLGICGTNDPYPDRPEVLSGMRRFTEAPSIPDAGRFVHWEKPKEFNESVRKFLDALD